MIGEAGKSRDCVWGAGEPSAKAEKSREKRRLMGEQVNQHGKQFSREKQRLTGEQVNQHGKQSSAERSRDREEEQVTQRRKQGQQKEAGIEKERREATGEENNN